MFESRRRLIYGLLWVAFANGVIAALISAQTILSTALPEPGLGMAYLLLQQVGHFQFLAWLLSLPLLVLALLLPMRALIRSLAFVVFTAFILLVYADYEIYQLYRFHLNSMVWNLLVGGAAQEILIFEFDSLITFAGIATIVLLTQWAVFKLVGFYQGLRVQSAGKWVFLTVLVIQVSGQGLHVWADAWQQREVISQVRYAPLAQPLKMKRFLRKRGWLPEVETTPDLARRIDGDFRYPLKPMQCQGSENRMNLLVIISDGLRADMLNPSVMPFWSNFSQQAQVFKRHYSSGNATRFGVFGLFSGLHGQYWFDAVTNNTTSVLMSELKRQQYRLGFFANARLSSPEFDRAIFFGVKDEIPKKMPGETVVDREFEITARVKKFIEIDDPNPFFSLLFFDAPHAYVYPPEDARFEPTLESINYLKLDNRSDPMLFKNRYKNSIAFNDRLSAEVVQSLRQSGQLDNTILVITGDHGQEMNETMTNSWGHNSNFSSYQAQVPMVIYWPGKEPAEYTHLSSHVDLVPTMMQELLGCSNPVGDYSNGRSLFDESERPFILSKNWNDYAIIDNQYSRVFTPYGSEVYRTEDYSKSDNADPLDSARQLKVLESISRFYQK